MKYPPRDCNIIEWTHRQREDLESRRRERDARAMPTIASRLPPMEMEPGTITFTTNDNPSYTAEYDVRFHA